YSASPMPNGIPSGDQKAADSAPDRHGGEPPGVFAGARENALMVAKVLKRLVAMAAFLVYGAHSAAQSPPVPVHYVFAGTFSGSLNGVPFNSNVSVIGNGDANLITGGPTFC